MIMLGLKELEDEKYRNMNERREQDKKRVLDLFQDIGANAKVVNNYQVGYPAVGKIQLLVVCLESSENRSAILNLATQLKNQPKWNKVYMAEDLTKNQYMLDKIRETSLKEKASRRNQQLNNQGIKWKVVGGERNKATLV
jgi:hypothetical protein